MTQSIIQKGKAHRYTLYLMPPCLSVYNPSYPQNNRIRKQYEHVLSPVIWISEIITVPQYNIHKVKHDNLIIQ